MSYVARSPKVDAGYQLSRAISAKFPPPCCCGCSELRRGRPDAVVIGYAGTGRRWPVQGRKAEGIDAKHLVLEVFPVEQSVEEYGMGWVVSVRQLARCQVVVEQAGGDVWGR